LPALNSGRPPALSSQKANEALDYVSKLNRQGCTLEVAKSRAAQRFGCSLRTIERLWIKRESIDADEEIVEVTMNDALNYFSTGE
jgi:hypothetical protein